jgi:L-fucose dehydrogenase
MNLEMRDKVVLVTGGAKGIGAAIARAVGVEGGVAVVVDRDVTASRALRAELDERGQRSFFIECDLSSAEACRAAVEKSLEYGGRIDVLVNNAGVNDKVGLAAGDPRSFVASLERNLMHFYNMAHYALASLAATKGSIVNIASKVAITGQGGTSGYAAAKGAILALTREWAVELIDRGIRVNAILPAEVMTPLYEAWLATFEHPEEKLAEITAKIPFEKRMTRPEEIADAALFLMSVRANHITGQHISVDGGYVHLDRALS